MMMRILLGTASAAALISLASAAEPAVKAKPPVYAPQESAAKIISPMDVKTRDDAEKLAVTEFNAADANFDGAVDAAEFTAFIEAKEKAALAANKPQLSQELLAEKEPAGRAFADYAAGDKTITRDEMVKALTARFDKADVNRDETLDDVEQQRFAALVSVRPEKTPDAL